ncbi:MAG: HipA domain-containing protein, partial [Candidatus Omnitrophota bacterium]
KGAVEQIGRKLKEISSAPGYDSQLFFERVVISFILGNGDAHLKNYSISYRGKDNIRLAPAYDIVCSKLVLPDEEDSAITINGKKNGLKIEDFNKLAEYLNIPAKIRYNNFINKYNTIKEIIGSSSLSDSKKQRFLKIVEDRLRRLGLPK